ncbi:hypothetical protein Tco_0736402 [Tanacetum coccineum]
MQMFKSFFLPPLGHQFWDSVYKHDTFYIFKIDKRKRLKLTLEVFKDIFKICPRVHGQDIDALPTDEEIVSFLINLGHTREIHSLNDVIVDQMHHPGGTFAASYRSLLKDNWLTSCSLQSTNPLGYVPSKEYGLCTKFKKPSFPKSYYPVSTEEPTGKSKRVKRPTKKSTQAPARGVVIRETLEMPVSKKKEKVDVARGKGIEMLSDVALKEDA